MNKLKLPPPLAATRTIDTPEFWALANAWASSTIDTPKRAAALIAFIESKVLGLPARLTPAMRDAVYPKWTFQPDSMYTDLLAAAAARPPTPLLSQRCTTCHEEFIAPPSCDTHAASG